MIPTAKAGLRIRQLRRKIRGASLLAAAGCVLVAVLAAAGCAGQKHGRSTQARAEIGEVSGAFVSHDGTLIAVWAQDVRDKTARGGLRRIWLFNPDTAAAAAVTPLDQDSQPPDLGPGGSYLVAVGQGLAWELYYAPDARTPPRPLAGPGREMLKGLVPLWKSAIAPDRASAVVVMRDEPPEGHQLLHTRAFAVPLEGRGAARTIWDVHTEDWIEPLGVYARPNSRGGNMAIFAGGPWPPYDEPGVIALSPQDGTVLWDRPFRMESGILDDAALYDPRTLLVLVDVEESATKAHSIIYAVDLLTGESRVFARIPDDCRWIDVLPGDRGHRLLFSGESNVWRIDIHGQPGKPELVIQSPDATTVGARDAAGHGPEVYAYGVHVLWRCRLRERTVQPVLGTPQREDGEPPRIVR